MDIFAINEARRAPRIGSLVVISGALLGIAGSAFGADLPPYYDYNSYRPTYYRYNGECYDCRPQVPVVSCVECRRPAPVIEHPVVEVAERHWVQRDYIERHYPTYAAGYSYEAYQDRSRCSYCYSGNYGGYTGNGGYYQGGGAEAYSGWEHRRRHARCFGRCEGYSAYEPAPPVGPRRKIGYGSLQYPPVPVAYAPGNVPPHAYERYGDLSRPFDYYRPGYEYGYKAEYEDGSSPRPPASVPSAYYGSGYN